MADLQFTKIENLDLYAAEVVVNSNFNIHFNRASGSGIRIYQKTGDKIETMDDRTADARGFDPVLLPGYIQDDSGKVFDYDFDALVYPKVIRIESYTEVTSGILTESGNEA